MGQIKESDKVAMVHIDLITGLSSKEVAVDFIRNNTSADGIISTKPALIKRARELSLYTTLRVFVLDSMAFENIEKQMSVARPDIIEIQMCIRDRSKAYNYALDGITNILQQNPSIEVVLDIHRDGVGENLHLVTQVDGRDTAQIMFFNGLSQTPEGPIEYLQNPYREDNLAFSLQMQLGAAAYYPGFTRKIYLKGLRYNEHLRPKSSLIEVGAQTNTYEEALNAMEPLSELLDMVLQGNRKDSIIQ